MSQLPRASRLTYAHEAQRPELGAVTVDIISAGRGAL